MTFQAYLDNIEDKTGQPFLIDLSGRASHVNLAGLPRTMRAPRIATNLSASAYHIKGSISRTTTIDGSATMAQSTIAGGTIVGGTTAQFGVKTGPRGLNG